ncbi:MAG: phytanoyl-CoA dioxygenase family protein [Parvibaculum sp.]|nr:phytanoyl-CoA dioxygenase family protein [Parvibaculum sp.]
MSAEKLFPEVETLAALGSDLAGTHKASRSEAAARVDPALVEADMRALERDGYVIIESLLGEDEIAEIKAALAPLLGHTGRNAFEGHKTQRLYAVPEKTRATDRLIEHPRILALLDRIFLPNYLLSQCQAINIMPGEAAQYLHADDGFYRVPRPRPPLGAATVWAIDEFTEENGATVVVPGSHVWPDGRMPGEDDRKIKAVMPAGSVVFYPGTLWHGGGANLSAAPRLAVTCQYCEPWLRTQENYFLSLSPETVKAVSEDMRRMLGYSIYPPFMGMVNGMHPKRLLDEAGVS